MTIQERPGAARVLDETVRLARLSLAVARAASTRDVALILLDELAAADPDPTIAISLVDEATHELELIGIRAAGGRSVDVRQRWSLDLPSPARDAVASRSRRDLDQAAYRTAYPEASAISDPAGMARHVALPIVAGSRAVGAVDLAWSEDPGLSPTTLEHLQSLVDVAAQAVGRAMLDEAERTARALMTAILDQLPLGVLVVAPGSPRPVYLNDAFREVYGLPADPIGPAGPDAPTTRVLRLDGTDWPVEERPLARALGGETTRDELVVLDPPAAARRIASVNAGPVRGADGAIVAAVGVYADVSARAEADAARDAFLGVLSHELRTPVTAIYGVAELLSRRLGADPAAQELAEDIADESRRLHRIVEDLLVLSRLERGVDLRRGDPVLLHHLVRRVVATESRHRPRLRFEVRIEPGMPAVSGDEAYLEQILRNLISNAAKYGPPDGRIRIVVEGAAGRVVLRVRDDGPGFRPGDESSVFELFYRAPSMARRAPGAGIGLYTVRALAAAMGGEAAATSHPDGGAEVTISLPVSEGA